MCRENGFARSFHRQCLDVLREHHWKGNVRELRSVVERHLIANESGVIHLNDLDIKIYEKAELATPQTLEEIDSHVENMKKNFVLEIIKRSASRADAARKLKVQQNRLSYFLTKWGINTVS